MCCAVWGHKEDSHQHWHIKNYPFSSQKTIKPEILGDRIRLWKERFPAQIVPKQVALKNSENCQTILPNRPPLSLLRGNSSSGLQKSVRDFGSSMTIQPRSSNTTWNESLESRGAGSLSTYSRSGWRTNGLEFPVNGISSNKLLKPIAVADPIVHIFIKEKGSCSALHESFFDCNNGTDGDGEALVNRSSPWLKHKHATHPVPGLNGLVCVCKQPPSIFREPRKKITISWPTGPEGWKATPSIYYL